MENAKIIAESFINGNLSWVKNECLNTDNIKIIAQVYDELKECNEEQAKKFMSWVCTW